VEAAADIMDEAVPFVQEFFAILPALLGGFDVMHS
jgi:hypothetical protein